MNLHWSFAFRRAKLWVIGLVSLCAAVAGAQPSTLNFTSAGPASIQLQNVHYDAGVVGTGPLSGSGDLIMTLGGGNNFTSPGTPFTGIYADSSGNVQLNKAGYMFKKDFPWNNFFGTGLNASLKSGFTIMVESGSGGNKVTLTGETVCQLPFRDENGQQATFSGNNSKLVVDASGTVKFDTDFVLANAPKVQAAGFGIAMDSPHLTVQSPGTPVLKLSSPTVTVATPIPSLLTDGPVVLKASNFAIDETGLPSFDSLTLGGSQASIDAAAAVEASNANISLLQPVNFGLELTGVGGSVKKGSFHDLHLEGNLTFPDDIKDDTNPSQPGVVPITFDLADPTFKRKGTGDVKLLWQPLSNGPKFHIDISSFTLDTSKGLTNLTASLRIEGDDRFANASGVKDVTFLAKGATFDGNGLTGTVGLQSAVNVYGVTAKSGSLTFERNALTGGAFFGDFPTPFGGIGLGLGVSETGVSVAVQASQGLTWPGFGKLNIKSGGGSVGKDGISVNLSGDLVMDVIKDVDLGFDDLAVDSHGNIAVDQLSLTKPVDIPIGPLTLHASKMAYSTTPTKSFKIDGDVKFPDSLPITGDVGFEGLEIPEHGNLKIGKITFKATVAGIGELDGLLESGGNHPDQGFTNTLEGSVNISAAFLGGAGLGGKFLIADGGAWLAGAQVKIPGGIPLPPPPPAGPVLFIDGFGAALGHNVTVRPPTENYPAPTDANPFTKYKFQNDNWLVEGTVDVTTTDHFTLWGPLSLDLTLPQFSVSLSGDMALLTPEPLGMNDNQRVRVTMGWFGDSFQAAGDLVFKVPLYEMTGKMSARIGPGPLPSFIYVGWPMPENGISNTVGLKGVVSHESKVGMGLDFYPTLKLQAGMSESVHLLVLEGSRWINVAFQPSLEDTSFGFTVGVSGSVDFIVVKLSASASATGEISLHNASSLHGSLSGDFTASIDTFLGSVDFHTSGEILSW